MKLTALAATIAPAILVLSTLPACSGDSGKGHESAFNTGSSSAGDGDTGGSNTTGGADTSGANTGATNTSTASGTATGTATGMESGASGTTGVSIVVPPTSGSSGGTGASSTAGACPGTPGCAPDCTPSGSETCDGIDNDCNGIIDDLDVNSDGVCDCLLIATLGVPGTWGDGDVFATWLSARSNNGATDLGSQVLTPDLLKQFQVIVAQDLSTSGRTYSADEVAALEAWVNAGGGFMTLIGYADSTERTNANTLLAPYQIDYAADRILPKNGGSTVPITEWYPHPITMGITAVGVDTGYPVEGTGTTIATGGGYTLGIAEDVGKGHVFAWGDEWITYDSEWQQHPDYQVELFWVNTIKWLSPVNQCQVPIPPIFVQ